MTVQSKKRLAIAFFEYHDVFEDFYPHYGVSLEEFSTTWAGTGSHAFVALIQEYIGDVTWYIFTLSGKSFSTKHAGTGCRVEVIPSSWFHRKLWHFFYSSKNSWRWQTAYPLYATLASYTSSLSSSFLRSIKSRRPDLIFTQDYATGRFDELIALGASLKIPIIAWHTGSVPSTYMGSTLKRWTIRRSNVLIASSSAEASMLEHTYRVSPERIKVILTPIDTSVFRPLDRKFALATLGLSLARRYLLIVGRLEDRIKRLSLLFDAFARIADELKNVHLLIVGDGPDRVNLAKDITNRGLGERVTFLGWMRDREELAVIYNAADFLVLPSRSEGFPTVIGEAMACGTPAIASRVGGVTELVIDGETGWTFAPQCAEEFRDVLYKASLRPETQGEMRRAARQIAEQRVARESVIKQLRACFQKPDVESD